MTSSRVLRRIALSVAPAGVAVSLGGAAQAAPNMIIGGQAEPGFPAVVALVSNGDWFCSGTVVAPRVVVTAAHCLADTTGPLDLYIGSHADQLGTGRLVHAESYAAHPSYASDDNYDIGVVVLAEDAGVTPIPVNLDGLSDSLVGRNALFVGFGVTSPEGDGGEKRSVTMPITEVNDFFVGNGTPGKNTCFGDSGGPTLATVGGEQRVIAVTSYGDAGCADYGYNTRTDAFASWISAFLAGGVPSGTVMNDGSGDVAGDVTGDVTGDGSGDTGDTGDTGDWSDGSGDTGDGDICAELGWYDDGVCDEDCAEPDPDCAADGSGDVTDDGSGDIVDDGSGDVTDDGSGDVTDDGSDIVDDGSGDAPAELPTGAPRAPTAGAGCAGGGDAGGLAALGMAMVVIAGLRRKGTVEGR